MCLVSSTDPVTKYTINTHSLADCTETCSWREERFICVL